jgi:DNA polymerase III delta prime subunit|tara:strand:- start:593 stop:1627 length:1035 start_codon:yes stop_codon:yes gene_type:complete
MIFVNKLINDITNLYNLTDNNCLNNLSNYDIPHLNLYGPDGSMKKFYAYHIINKLNNININTKHIDIQEQNILIKNNNLTFKLISHKYFKEINLYFKLNNEKHILKEYILPIIQNKNILTKKHIFIINDFDKLKYNSFMLLRRVMEIHSNNVLFIFISTNISIIPEAIRSRCLNIRCPLLKNNEIKKIVSSLTNNYNIDNKDITKLIKKNENDIYKILLNLENFTNENIELRDVLYEDILTHLKYMKNEKCPYKVLPKNREFIYKLINFNFNNKIILEKILIIILKKFKKKLPIQDVIKLTSQTDANIIDASREIYHFELYFLKIFKMFHNNNMNFITNNITSS